MQNTSPMKLLTIVSEALLESRLVEDLEKLGVIGYSISTVKGDLRGHVRASEWEGANIKIESLLSPELADKVLHLLNSEYFPSYAVIAYLTEAEVIRADKFSIKRP